MPLKFIYLILCIVGTVVPLSQLAPWIIEHGLDLSAFIRELFSTRVGAFFGWDVIISAIALLVFIYFEGRHSKMQKLWLPSIATISIGVSLGLPLFLYMRQIQKQKCIY